MKTLIITALLACFFLLLSAPYFVIQNDNHQESSKCISKLVKNGVERSAIGVSGKDCFIK